MLQLCNTTLLLLFCGFELRFLCQAVCNFSGGAPKLEKVGAPRKLTLVRTVTTTAKLAGSVIAKRSPPPSYSDPFWLERALEETGDCLRC
jgi:hypothetical protein